MWKRLSQQVLEANGEPHLEGMKNVDMMVTDMTLGFGLIYPHLCFQPKQLSLDFTADVEERK